MSRMPSHGGFSDELLAKVKEELSGNLEFSEPQPPLDRNKAGMPSIVGFAEQHFDFTTCQRSDGSYYGTGGTCRKGSEVKGGKPEGEKKGSSGGGGGSGGGGDAASRKANNVAIAKKAEAAAGSAVTTAEGKRDQAQAAANDARQAVKQAESNVKSAAIEAKEVKKFGDAATDGLKKYKQDGSPAERKAENVRRAEEALQKAKMDVVKAENKRDQAEARESAAVQAVKQAESNLKSAIQERKDVEKFGDAATDGLKKYQQP